MTPRDLIGPELETTLSANNLTDTALFDQCGLPRPGRTLSVQVRLY